MVKRSENHVREQIRSHFELTFDERVARAMEMDHQQIVPYHHFAAVSMECVYLYQDGYFTATIMATQALNEGLVRFIEDRNGITERIERPIAVERLRERGLLSAEAADASTRIMRSFRNDFHHMNPSVSHVPVREIAKRNIEDICAIENEIFACDFDNGKIRPRHRQYWNVSADGTMTISLRP